MFSSDALTPELYDTLNALGLLNLFGSSATQMTGLGDLQLKELLPAHLGRQLLDRITPLGISVVPVPNTQLLPTGTYRLTLQGNLTQISVLPGDSYVFIDDRKGTTLTADWKVGGAATVMLDTGTQTVFHTELPTKAAITVTRTSTGKQLAAAAFGMTPGTCLSSSGPDALSVSVWGGNAARPELTGSLSYTWTDQGLTFKEAASLTTTKGQLKADSTLDLRGTTTNRCDLAKLSFVPTRMEATASASVPNDSLSASVNVRDVSNLVLSADALNVQNPFAKVAGKLLATADHNGQHFFTAFGPLADGSDLDLNPGDQVEVKYVLNGKLVVTNLGELLNRQ